MGRGKPYLTSGSFSFPSPLTPFACTLGFGDATTLVKMAYNDPLLPGLFIKKGAFFLLPEQDFSFALNKNRITHIKKFY